MAKHKVLYTDSTMKDIVIERDILAQYDAELVMASSTDEEALMREGMDCIAVMNEYARIGGDLISAWAAGGNVKCISKQGIGVDTIDVDAATRCGIMVANVPDYCIDEVSDHAVALALACWRQLKDFDQMIRRCEWQEVALRPLYRTSGKTVGIYGFGNIARRFASKMQVFGFKTFAYDPYARDELFAERNTTRVDSLDELVSISDIFSVHAPLTSGTRHSVNRQLFAAMKRGCIFINTARGGVVDTDAFIDAIDKGIVSAAGLDVFENEPLELGSKLRRRDNVILTPHVAFYSEESEVELREKVALNVAHVITDGEPLYYLNKRAMDAQTT